MSVQASEIAQEKTGMQETRVLDCLRYWSGGNIHHCFRSNPHKHFTQIVCFFLTGQ